jgi:hypothetical protein
VFAGLAVFAVGRASVGTGVVLGALSVAILVQMGRQSGASVGLCLRALELETPSGADAKAELMDALEGGVATARSRIHAVAE